MNANKQYLKDRWAKRKQLVLSAMVELCKTPKFNEKGVLAADVERIILHLHTDVTIGIDAIRAVFHDLENENVIFCVNPSNSSRRRFLLVKNQER